MIVVKIVLILAKISNRESRNLNASIDAQCFLLSFFFFSVRPEVNSAALERFSLLSRPLLFVPSPMQRTQCCQCDVRRICQAPRRNVPNQGRFACAAS